MHIIHWRNWNINGVFLRWGRGRNYGGREPSKSSLMAARIVGAAIIAMVVVTYLSLTQQ